MANSAEAWKTHDEAEPRSFWTRLVVTVGAVVVLLLAAVGAKTLLWPGPILAPQSAKRFPVSQPAPPTDPGAPQISTLTNSSSPSAGTLLATFAPTGRVDSRTLPSLEEARARLTNVVAFPTTILVGNPTERHLLPASHPLARMLNVCIEKTASQAAECHWRTGTFMALLSASTNGPRAALDLLAGGTATIELPDGASLKLGFRERSSHDAGTEPGVLEVRVENLMQPIALSIHPGAVATGSFEPFTMIWWPEQAPVEPCRLDLSLLHANQSTVLNSLDAALRDRVAIFHQNKQVTGLLKPYIGTESVYSKWLDKSPPEVELDFEGARARVLRRQVELNEERKTLKSRRDFWLADALLGQMAGMAATDPGYQFETYCRSNGLAISGAHYIRYLTNVLARIPFATSNALPDLAGRLQLPQLRESTLAGLGSYLTNCTPPMFQGDDLQRLLSDHFINRYRGANRPEGSSVPRKPNEKDEHQNRASRKEIDSMLDNLPRDVAHLSHASLILPVGKGRRLEFFRFEPESNATSPPPIASP